jgi:hypothetical protein
MILLVKGLKWKLSLLLFEDSANLDAR